MDTFELCRDASERVAWSFEKSFGDLEFDLSRSLLPKRLCGEELPQWLSPEERRSLNHIRAFSYAHIFLFVEEFIILQTCNTALSFVHEDSAALSAMLRFSEEETKHQRMFTRVMDLLAKELGFRPGALPGKEQVARDIHSKSPFAVFLLTLVLEWLTQRHYVECFQQDEANLDAGFVRVFRLHWTEEAQHARMDAVQLRRLAASMSSDEIHAATVEFLELVDTLQALLEKQDTLDVQTFEEAIGEPLEPVRRAELLSALNREWLWTFLVSGLQHKSFQAVFHDVVPSDGLSISQVLEHLNWIENSPIQVSTAPSRAQMEAPSSA